MDNSTLTMRLAEYNTLRKELLQNKQYVFERPLLIITAAGVAAVQLSGSPSLVLLPPLIIMIMLINLWFTVNRLMSIARIAAYVAVVLESAPHIWIGWENSLRIHRIWMNRHSRKRQKYKQSHDLARQHMKEGKIRQEGPLSKHIKSEAIPDTMMFYGPLFLLHAATVVVVLSVSGISVTITQGWAEIASFAATFIAALVFTSFSAGPYRPGKMRGLIEIQRAVWIKALKPDIKSGTTEPPDETNNGNH